MFFKKGLGRISLSDETWSGCALPLFAHQFAQMHWHSIFFFLLILSSILGSELYGCDCCETCMCKLDICEAYLIK